jgi:hypothetical protein
MQVKLQKLIDLFKRKNYDIDIRFYKTSNMYVFFWEGYIVGKYKLDYFYTLPNEQIFEITKKMIYRIKQLFSSHSYGDKKTTKSIFINKNYAGE